LQKRSLNYFLSKNPAITWLHVLVLPQFATKEPRSYSLTPSPSPVGCGGESEGKRQKFVGWNENSLTEWQREKKTAVNNTNKKHIQHVVFSPPNTQLLLSSKSPFFSQLPLKY